MKVPWWRDAVVYEIYVRSFADSDGDGIGDLPGIRARLPDLVDLGVDAVWLTPFYRSPQADGGYDVADHRSVDPLFGTLDDLDAVIAEAHRLGLRIVVDLVPNHTSNEHPWFRAALAAPPESAERARYVFRHGNGEHGELPPNDWQSLFGGPAWERVPDGRSDYYLHLFAPEQPDLDWTNPEVRAEFDDILRFWLARGIDGFRIDVAHGLAKDPAFPDISGRYPAGGLADVGHPHWDRDDVHGVYREWRRVLEEFDGDRMFVAEAYLRSAERLSHYVRPDELHTTFNFNVLHAPFDALALRTVIDDSITAMGSVGAPPTWVLSSHDAPRHVTRYGGGEVGERRARAATMLVLGLPGSAYLYQGEELGLPDVEDLPDDVLADPTFLRSGGVDRGRDGCRVPIPWSGDEPSFGFGPGEASWLPQPAGWSGRTRERQSSDPSSTLSMYRAALRIRREVLTGAGTGTGTGTGTDAGPEWIDLGPDVLAYRRTPSFVCVVNLGDAPVDHPFVDADLLLASRPDESGTIEHGTMPPATAAWFAVG